MVESYATSDTALTITAPEGVDGLGVYNLSLARDSLLDGIYSSLITFNTDSSKTPTKTVTVTYEVASSVAAEGRVGVVWINIWNADTDENNWFYIESEENEYSYVIEDLNPGTYTVIAGSDPDNDGYVGGTSEVLAGYPNIDEPTLLVANANFSAVDLDLELELPINQLGSGEVSAPTSQSFMRPEKCDKSNVKAVIENNKLQKCARRLIGAASND